jgi:hypothetical protein
MVAGCADSRIAASNAASGASAQASGETAEYKTGYGLTNNGPTTDLYTELFRSKKRDDKSAPSDEKSAPTTVSGTVASNTVQQDQPAPAPGVVRQETAAPEAPPQSTVYGIPSNGNTTDLYTELFGPRRRE